MAETVNINGHTVDAEKVDRFYNGGDGTRVTDEQWDESRDRTADTLDDLRALGFAYVGDTCPDGHEIAEGVDDGGLVSTDHELGG